MHAHAYAHYYHFHFYKPYVPVFTLLASTWAIYRVKPVLVLLASPWAIYKTRTVLTLLAATWAIYKVRPITLNIIRLCPYFACLSLGHLQSKANYLSFIIICP
jgi:hypothetical protein